MTTVAVSLGFWFMSEEERLIPDDSEEKWVNARRPFRLGSWLELRPLPRVANVQSSGVRERTLFVPDGVLRGGRGLQHRCRGQGVRRRGPAARSARRIAGAGPTGSLPIPTPLSCVATPESHKRRYRESPASVAVGTVGADLVPLARFPLEPPRALRPLAWPLEWPVERLGNFKAISVRATKPELHYLEVS